MIKNVSIKLDCENDSFQEVQFEVQITDVLDYIRGLLIREQYSRHEQCRTIKDVNGNTVGTVEFEVSNE